MYLRPDFFYGPRVPGVRSSMRLALELRVSRGKCVQRLRQLHINLPPLHAILNQNMATFDFSVKLSNHPTRAAIYSNESAAAAMMFPIIAPYLAGLQATIGTGAPPRECSFVCQCTPLCAAHRSLSARRFAAQRMLRRAAARARARTPSKRPSSAE